jgi:PAS domain-containing protein
MKCQGDVLGDEEKSRDELIKELEDSQRQLREFRALMGVEGAPEEELRPDKASRPESPHEGTNGPDFSEGTQSIDLSGLFTRHVSTSGSFHAKGIGETLFGKLLEALPIPSLLVDSGLLVRFANQACKRIDDDYNSALGKPFAEFFENSTAGEKAESLLKSVFDTRKPRYCIALLKINDGRIWGRVTLRSVRVGRDRFILALAEDLTAEKKQLLLKEELNAELRVEIARRKRVQKKQGMTEQRLKLAMKGGDLAWWDLNFQTGSVLCDKSFSETLGYYADEIAPERSSWEQMVHPDDRPRSTKALDLPPKKWSGF